MSSLDGVGRYFPLTLFACADDNAAIPPPELLSQDEWFDAAEDLLLSTLDHDATFESISARVENWAAPHQENMIEPNPLDLMIGTEGRTFCETFTSMRARDHHKIYAGSTFWWTVGGDAFPPVALCGKRMPDPYVFSAMLTGEFAKSSV